MEVLETSSGADRVAVELHGSFALELFWALRAAGHPGLRARHKELEALFATDPALAAAITGFWQDEEPAFLELLVLAASAGALESEVADDVLGALARRAASPPGAFGLVSEPESRRVRIGARLETLAAQPQLRREYLLLLGQVAGAIGPSWQEHGREVVALACVRLRTALERATSWVELVDAPDGARQELGRLLASIEDRTPVHIVPANGSGDVLVLDVSGLVLVGVPARVPTRFSGRAAQLLASRTRALGDPTRLLILDLLVSSPLTVGELTIELGLAQPTVSNHVRLLRDAGLVEVARRGTRRELVVDGVGATALLEELRELLAARRPSAYSGVGPGVGAASRR